MRDLIELLRSQPILVVLLAAWVFGAISSAVQKQRRQQQQKPRRPADGDASAPRRPTADEVAAEMRRVLGLDPPPRPAAKPPKPPAGKPPPGKPPAGKPPAG